MVQSINLDGLLIFPYARWINPNLIIPHFSVQTVADIDPWQLKQAGFKGVIFDKDNTLTKPYVNQIYPTLRNSVEQFTETFGDRIIINSNSAGTRDDRDYEDAKRIENDLGIKVLRHNRKKPGGIKEVKDYFHCAPQELVMIGDRLFTDIVFGNRYGMLTIHTQMLTSEGDNKAAAKVRTYELPLLEKLRSKRIIPPHHALYQKGFCKEI